jgi:BirA family biotin operon repressor/biotin-[acetyl-CoA-carboxylase] ligase
MHLIKLNAIDSTNSYLKDLVSLQPLKNFTVVFAQHQTNGRGQMGTVWESDTGKNLTVSILIKFIDLDIQNRFYLNMAISLAILETVKKYVKIKPMIKWPNDILADEFKIAGILLENSFSGEKIRHSIVGLGLNVNQTNFSQLNLTASSLKIISGETFDLMELLNNLMIVIKKYIKILENKEFNLLKTNYVKNLYGFNKSLIFSNTDNNTFEGKICDITKDGLLVVQTTLGEMKSFDLKEIKFTKNITI